MLNNLEEFKKEWSEENLTENFIPVDKKTWIQVLKERANRQRDVSMKYFWGVFILHLIVYGFLTNVIIRNLEDQELILVTIGCFLLYIPFTAILLLKFKKMAVLRTEKKYKSGLSVKLFVESQYNLLMDFYVFKRRYEVFLVPLSSAILIWVTFRLYLPGGVYQYPGPAIVLFLITMTSCFWAIWNENKKSFREPLQKLKAILEELQH
ncbi:hypothetical protein [Algoriphagus litoralis]|uniref:hypothetical protein n=1 Tax=Algoriphagus litoralis TaxID=2202829 RepID=UPI000DB9EF7B|nr:hypothetical protein [Algoriphagus litoralis]